MEKMGENIKCYIVKNDCTLFSYKEWKKNYTNFLKEFYQKETWNSREDCYNDPDNSSDYFYKDLVVFLNNSEERLKGKLNERYKYEFSGNPYGISVFDASNKSMFPIFYLKSDQFGFSAPSKDKNHPYDKYLQYSGSDSEKSIKKVIDWIYYSRTLGGSFLWPMEQSKYGYWKSNPYYNMIRGGKMNNNERYYIEDRVDLTLLEIEQLYKREEDKKYIEKNRLYSCYEKEKNMKKWMNHFETFDNYIDFFCLQMFLINHKERKGPINFLSNESHILMLDRTRKKELCNASEDELENFFNKICRLIQERSIKMKNV